MSSEMPILNKNAAIINNISMAANISSSYSDISESTNIAYHASWTGSSPSGSLQVYVSNDLTLNPIAYGSAIAITGNSGSSGLNLENLGFIYIGFVYTASSGSGNLTVKLAAKR